MNRVASRLALVALLAAIAGFGWWLTQREAQAPDVRDLETADGGTGATKPPDPASLEGNAGSAASRKTRLPRGEGAIVGTVRRDGLPVAARIAIQVAHAGEGYNPWGRSPTSMAERALALPPSPDAASGSVQAGEDGRFTLAGVGAGAFPLVAETADGAIGATLALVPVEGARVEVSIAVAGGGESLRGRVVWADGRPFAGTLRVGPDLSGGRGSNPLGPEGRVAVADADGRFVARGLPAGLVAVTAYVDGRLVVTGAPVTLPHAGEYVLTLDDGLVHVVGRVLRQDDDAPVPGASVTASGRSPGLQSVMSRATTDADGRFELPAPRGSDGRLFAQAAGFASASVPAPPAVPTEPFAIRLSRGTTVNGRVTRDSDGAPVAGLTVSANPIGWRDHRPTPETATTDADGRYRLAGPAVGEAMVVAWGQGYVTKGAEQASFNGYNPLAVTLRSGEDTTVDLVVTAGARIEGIALDAAGAPVVEAVVQRYASSAGLGQLGAASPVVTDNEGRFVLEGNVPGTACTLSAEAPGLPTARAGVTPVAGTTTQVEIRFAAARFVDLTVLDAAAGTPIAGARIVPRTWTGNSYGRGMSLFSSASDGRARVGPLAFGEQKVGVEAPGYAGVLQAVAESDTSLVVRLKAGGEFTGRVTFADGSPAAGVPVTVHGAFGFAPPGTTGTDGTFLLRSVPVGPFTLRAHTLKDGTLVEATMTIDDGVGGVVLRLGAHGGQEPGGPRLVARVLDPQGRPVPQAQAVLRTPNGASQQSVRDGRVEWTQAIPAGSGAVVEVRAARDASGAFLPLGPATATVPDGATEVEMRLVPEVTVSGTVRGSDGAPVRGVLVRAGPVASEQGRRDQEYAADPFHHDLPQFRTDDAGAFRVGGLAAVEYDLTVVAPSTWAPWKPLRVRGGDRDVDVRLKTALTVTVTVRGADGTPVAGARVSGRPKAPEVPGVHPELRERLNRLGGDDAVRTGADGVARLSGLDGDVIHTLQVSGRRHDLGPVTIDPWTPRDETVTLPRVWSVAGVVRDPAGRPVANAYVERKGSDGRWNGTGADEKGQFQMTGLPQDDVVLRATVPGIPFDDAGTTGQVRVTAGTRSVVITIDPGLDLVVHVENPRDLGPRLPGASLRVRRGAQTIQLYSDGEPTTGYRFRGLASGDVGTFWILSEGGTHSVHAPGLKPGADVRVRAIAGRSITVRLKGSAGASSVRVGADHEGLGVGGQVRSDGSYEIRGLPEGTSWTITGEALSSDGSTRLTGRATAVAGGTVELELKPWQPLRAR